MRCEELEAIVFSGRKVTAEEREEMEAHAKTCEACRALLDNADVLADVQQMDADVTVPESFAKSWRSAIRQTPRVIAVGDWMRRKGARVLGYAACAALVFAAGTGVGRLSGEETAMQTAYDYDTYEYDAYTADGVGAVNESSYAPMLGARSASAKSAAEEKKIIRNAWLSLRTERFDETVQALCEQIEQAGGVVESRDISGTKDTSRSASLTLRVPSGMLDDVLAGAEAWGEVTHEQTSAVDMTDTYTDNASRLESARAKKNRLDALYEQAESMEDIITLTNALFDVQAEIESLEGQNSRIDDEVSLATLYVSVSEKSSAVNAKQPFFTRLGRQAMNGLEQFGAFLSDAAMGLAYALPWLAVAAAVLAAARAVIRKKKR